MTVHALTLHHQTKLAVHIIVEDDTGVLAYSILFVANLFAYIWKIRQFVTANRREFSVLVTDLKTALDFTAKVFAIGFNSLIFGLGVML